LKKAVYSGIDREGVNKGQNSGKKPVVAVRPTITGILLNSTLLKFFISMLYVESQAVAIEPTAGE